MQTAGCPFCKMHQRVLKENQHANLFLSNPRKVKGHFLVTSKRHVEKPWELRDEEVLSIMELVFFTQRRLVEKFNAGGCDIKQNYRPFLKQGRVKVDHVHYHVYPREFEDGLYKKVEIYEEFTDLSEAEHDQLAKIVTDE